MRIMKALAALVLLPVLLTAQQEAIERLRAVLPADIADRVIAIVTDATSRGLPGDAVADRALEAVAKGRSGAEASTAAQALAADLAASREALERAGRSPDPGEIEAGATAKQLGVDGATISALASGAPSGRSLAVPLAVLGALVSRGLPADAALQSVLDRLKARASDAELAELPGEAGRLIAEGYKPGDVGRSLSAAGRPGSVPTNSGRVGGRPARP